MTPARLVLPPGAVAALAVLVATGCGAHEEAAHVEPSPKATIVVAEDAYEPNQVRVETGDRVTFVGASDVPNTAETNGVAPMEFDREKLDRRNQFDLHTIARGEAHSVEFDTPGTYSFHSSFNGTMFGVVEVVEPSAD